MKMLLATAAIVTGTVGVAFAEDATQPDATTEIKAVTVLSDQEMDQVVGGAHIRNMLDRRGVNFSENAFDALGAAGSTLRGPAPGAEVETINGLFQ